MAKKAKELLTGEMTRAEIAEAQKLSRKYREAFAVRPQYTIGFIKLPGNLISGSIHSDRPFVGILLMVASIASFACMDAIIKWLTGIYPVLQVIALRSWCGLPFLLLIVHLQGGFSRLRTRRPEVHLLRFMFVLGLTTSFSWALSQMKLVDAVALTFVAPILVAILSVPLLGESVGRHRWTAVLAGFVRHHRDAAAWQRSVSMGFGGGGDERSLLCIAHGDHTQVQIHREYRGTDVLAGIRGWRWSGSQLHRSIG